MKDTGHGVLVLLVSLLTVLTGCSRREIVDDYPVSGVRIRFDWTGTTSRLPEKMKVIFYPKNGYGVRKEAFLSAAGGEVRVPPGRYAVVAYNYFTESVCIRGDEAYETMEAYTDVCKGMNLPETMVWEPDLLYTVSMDELELKKSDVALDIACKPMLVVKTYSFELKAAGLNYASEIIGAVDGMGGCYFPSSGKSFMSSFPIYFQAKKADGVIKGHFNAFGIPKEEITRSDLTMMLKMYIVRVDGSVQKEEIDITKTIIDADDGSVGGDESPAMNIELPLDEEIKVDEVVPTPGGGGGIGGEVGGWGEEEEVELPV